MLYTRFDDADWPRLERDWRQWWEHDLERPLIVLTTRHFPPSRENRQVDIWEGLTQFPPDTPPDQVLEHGRLWLEATHYYADAFPAWWPNFGPGIVAGFLGSRVEHGERTAWFHPLGRPSLRDITLRADPENVWWRQVKAGTQAAVTRWGTEVSIGYADLGGNLDILASLRGTQELLLDVIDDPQAIARLSPELTTLWLQYFERLHSLIAPAGRGASCWGPCWFPTSGYFLQSDFSYMVAPKIFERFVLPDLARCCEAMDYPFYHLDGKGELKHLDMLLSLGKLRGVQWQPGDGQPRADQWPEVLRRIRAAGKLCHISVDRTGAFTVARELGGRGFVMEILEDLSDQEAEEFLLAFWHEFLPGQAVPGASTHAPV